MTTTIDPIKSNECVPSFLQASEKYACWDDFKKVRIMEGFAVFAEEFGIDEKVATAAVLCGMGQTLGGAKAIKSPNGQIGMPFNLMIITPDEKPDWIDTPLVYLAEGIHKEPNFLFRRETPLPGDHSEKALAKLQHQPSITGAIYVGTHNTILQRAPTPHFTASPLDLHITLATPPGGLLEALRLMTPEDLVQLKDILSADTPSPAHHTGEKDGIPSFLWQAPKHDAHHLMHENPWIASLPFLMLEASQTSAFGHDPDSRVLQTFYKMYQDHFDTRCHYAQYPSPYCIDPSIQQPAIEFLTEGEARQAEEGNNKYLPVRWIARLAIRFSVLLSMLDSRKNPDLEMVELGLELAKALYREHLGTLSKYSQFPTDFTDSSGLANKVYMRICERGAISPTNLSRSFSNLRAKQRDEIIAKLLACDLIEIVDGLLRQKAAPYSDTTASPIA